MTVHSSRYSFTDRKQRREMYSCFFGYSYTGYLRILLLFFAWRYVHNYPVAFIAIYSLQVILDWADGWAARKFNQATTFGAWFDVVIDNVGRGLLWCHIHKMGYLVSALEWLTFVCTHQAGRNWRQSMTKAPWLVRKTMADGFKTPLGILVIAGLHALPICVYAVTTGVLPQASFDAGITLVLATILVVGRTLCAVVELWCIGAHAHLLLKED
ncbi:PREDICTED: CDP-diacylglycerol--inositol 3-phosphatidyltransferase 1-like [Priapulus caudatus]|uniref:CDP-diacylglycerol--inositol 3-phosphatidyltransferase 1-like n=1 Tax=Priapulus caudatus TaxID=37621 RepID=A0ABM1EMV5_PRICU|nr:PREDICTED: CDP-diacylglycerol--inositol 3-phosphatidyltransferase 1-like [Priapulus caudatus]